MTIVLDRKGVSNFNFSLVFVGTIKLNFCYKKMTEKMYDNLQGEIQKWCFSGFKNMQSV